MTTKLRALTLDDMPAPVTWKPQAAIVDLDGTVALRGDRSPYDDTDRVLDDRLNRNVAIVVDALYLAGYKIVFMSGRQERCRAATELWLARHFNFRPEGLYMRKDGDRRDDAIVKRELYETWVEPDLNVVVVIDDRDRVVAMWREIGLTCMQVAYGNF